MASHDKYRHFVTSQNYQININHALINEWKGVVFYISFVKMSF